jgi:hypothetical protein
VTKYTNYTDDKTAMQSPFILPFFLPPFIADLSPYNHHPFSPPPAFNQRKRRKNNRRAFAAGYKKAFA